MALDVEQSPLAARKLCDAYGRPGDQRGDQICMGKLSWNIDAVLMSRSERAADQQIICGIADRVIPIS